MGKKILSKVCKTIIISLFFISSVLIMSPLETREVFAMDNNIDKEYIEGFNGKSQEQMVSASVSKKVAFLTFDDGPSGNNTPKILNILKQNNIKATFFVIGKEAERNPQVLKELNNSGMCILPHTYCHDYKIIYSSVENYFKDLEKCKNVIRKITGKSPEFYTRLPGGSDNLVCKAENLRSIRNRLNAKGIDYVDWNVSSGDATGNSVPTSTIKSNIVSQVGNSKTAVVLMHDGYYKTTTVEALPETIKSLKSQGFTFKTFDDLTPGERTKMIKMGVINRR
ncbi:polysaccharide deacetylase family protein [Clostridium rectalis]|uniref:polysaccharide deacetylase family protein n=1 Tax=Clostridium rectalis TaxID=2040295 RepID=UPI001FAACB90|nr:polysaccharide deacetylase family protein [Clostridium rectalis]